MYKLKDKFSSVKLFSSRPTPQIKRFPSSNLFVHLNKIQFNSPCIISHQIRFTTNFPKDEDVQKVVPAIVSSATPEPAITTSNPHVFTIKSFIDGLSVGCLMGLFGSVVGVGGGIIAVPLLVWRQGLSFKEGAGTTVIAVASTGMASSYYYFSHGLVDISSGMILAVFATMTAGVGAFLTKKISDRAIKKALAIFLCISGPLTLLRAYLQEEKAKEDSNNNDQLSKEAEPAPTVVGIDKTQVENRPLTLISILDSLEEPKWPAPLLAVVGSMVGLFAGLTGLGGGALMIPILTATAQSNLPNKLTIADESSTTSASIAPLVKIVKPFTITQQLIVGTSLFALIPSALTSAFAHHRMGNVRLPVVPGLILGTISGSYLGSKVSLGLTDKQLKWICTIMFFCMGVKMFPR